MISIEDLTDVTLAIEDTDEGDEDDEDDIYIMVKCMSVCHKSHYFCIQRIWPFLMFPDTFRTQRICRFHVY